MSQPAAHTVRPVSRLGALLTLVPLTAWMGLGWVLLKGPDGIIAGAAAFLAYRVIVVRLWLCADHRRGVKATRGGAFEAGIAHFRRSEQAWARRPLLDRNRAILLGSAAPWGFHTMALYNMAFCLSQLGRGAEAQAVLGALLAEDPGNTLASSLAAVLDAGAASRGADTDPVDTHNSTGSAPPM